MSEDSSVSEHLQTQEEASKEMLAKIRDRVEGFALKYGTSTPIPDGTLRVDLGLGERPVLDEQPLKTYRATEAQIAHIRQNISGAARLWGSDLSGIALYAELPYYLNTDTGNPNPVLEDIIEEDYSKSSDFGVSKGNPAESYWMYTFEYEEGPDQFSKRADDDRRIFVNPHDVRISVQDALVIEDVLDYLEADLVA